MDRPLVVKILFVIAVVCLGVAFIVTAEWVDAAGSARDCWLIGGLLVLATGFTVERL